MTAACALIAGAPGAHAGVLSGSADGLDFSAGDGEANNVTIAPVTGGYRVRDEGAALTVSGTCTASGDPNEAHCSASNAWLRVSLGDKNDRLTATGSGVSVEGGDGTDVATVTGRGITFRGGAGSDRLTATAGSITAEGGDGDDVLTATTPFPRSVGSEDVNDDFSGGPGDDRIQGGSRRDWITGGPGDDVIDAGAGNDDVGGDSLDFYFGMPATFGNDRVAGGPGDDQVSGGKGDDAVGGGDGDDSLYPGPGSDSIGGGPGKDSFTYADRRTPVVVSLAGGSGFGEAGENDTLAADIEEVGGGSAGDWITGNGSANSLSGGPGNDVVDGGGGRGDFVGGGPDDDLVFAYDGDQALVGEQPNPTIGIFGNLDDLVLCDSGAGNPGDGRDTGVMDPVDVATSLPTEITPDCETVLFGPRPVTLRANRKALSVRVPCIQGLKSCKGTVRVRTIQGESARPRLSTAPKWRSLGRRKFSRKGKKGRKVKVKLSRRALRRAGRGKRVRAFVTYEYRR